MAANDNARGNGSEVVVTVSIRVKPGCEEAFLRLVTPVLDAMRHETTFVNAVLHQDPEDPTRFMLYETWADRDDLSRVQVHRDYREAYWARLPELLLEPRKVQAWRPLRGDFAFFAATRARRPRVGNACAFPAVRTAVAAPPGAGSIAPTRGPRWRQRAVRPRRSH